MPEVIGGVGVVVEVEAASITLGVPPGCTTLLTPGEGGITWRLSNDSVAEWVISWGSGVRFGLLPVAAADEQRVTELKSRSNCAI